MSRIFGWEPKQKTDLVLVNDSDRTNAFTVSYPANIIQLDVVPPSLSQGIFHYGDWLRWLLVHEYSHVVHLDRVAGLPRLFRPLLGSFSKPNMLQPAWLTEGMAVVAESELDTGGRAASSTFRMILRAAERSGQLGSRTFGSLESASYQKGEAWPWVLRSYLWGSVLAEAIKDAEPDAFSKLAEAGGGGVPGFLGPAFSRAGLPDPQEIQQRGVAMARERARAELGILSRRPESPAEALTTDGYAKFGLSVDPEGRELVFTREIPEDDNQAVLVGLDQEGRARFRRNLFVRQNGYQVSYSRSGRYIAFDDVDVHEKFHLWSDLFLFDRDAGREVLRSGGLRGRDPDIHPDGVTIAFVQTVVDRNRLVLCDSGFGNLREVYRPEGFRRLMEPRFSPDGKSLVFAEHDDETGGDRLLLWTEDGEVVELTDGASQNRDPSFSPDGTFLLFSSDRSGVFQIFALELSTGELRQVTHRYGGAFWPAPDPRGRSLYFLDYSERGYDVARMPWEPDLWWPPDPASWLPPSGSKVAPIQPDGSTIPEANPYRSLPYLAPSYLQPSLVFRPEGMQLGLSTGGVDPLYRHHYRLSVRWDTATRKVAGEGYYYNASGKVPWTFEIAQDAYEVENGRDKLDLTTADLRFHFPIGAHRHRRQLQLGLIGQRYGQRDGTQLLAGGLFRFEQDFRLAQPNDVVPEVGHFLSTQLTYLLRNEGPPVTIVQGAVEKPFRIRALGPHSILSLGLQGAWVEAGSGPEYLLYGGGDLSFPFSLSSPYRLGGYAPNALAADRLALASVRFTRPVASIERGFATIPGYLDRLSVGFRGEAGYFERSGIGRWPWSLGAEMIAEAEPAKLWPVKVTLGVYRGDPESGGSTRLVLSIALLK